MRTVPSLCVAAAMLVTLPHVRAEGVEGAGLTARIGPSAWSRFDARLITSPAPRWRAELAPLERPGLKVRSLLGDVYFGAAQSGLDRQPAGGFRATSGLVFGSSPAVASSSVGGLSSAPRRPAGGWASAVAGAGDPAAETLTVPYLGVGYSNAWPKSGWRISADVGVLSYNPGSASGIGRVLGGSQSLDDLVRDMRLAPLLQLGVSYSF